MNDHGLPPDELASAFLDDELTAAESEAVRQDPDLTARAGELRQATEAVGETVTPPPGAADAAVEAALADFDARRRAPADMARRRPRGLAVITGVAAAVAIGFVVAAAVGLFAERGDDAADTAAAPAPPAEPAAAEAAAAPAEPPPPAAPEPAPEPPPPPAADEAFAASAADTEAMEAIEAAEAMAEEALEVAEAAQAAAALAQATAEGNQAAVAAAEADLAEAQAAAEAARAEAAAAQAEAAEARSAAAEPQAATTVAEPSPAPAPEPAPAPAADTGTMADDMAADDMAADPAPDACAAAIGDGSVELRITVGDTPLLIVRNTQDEPAVLDAATCAQIPPDEAIVPLPGACATAIGAGTAELRITVGDTPLLIVRNTQDEPAVLDAATCAQIPPG